MENGVYTSVNLEIAQTKHWAICFYCNSEKSVIGAELYYGIDDCKKLVAICKRFVEDKRTVYAYQTMDEVIFTNDYDGVYKHIGSAFEYRIEQLKKIDSINIVEPYEMATVDEKGIGFCLKQWRMGTSYDVYPNGFTFQMVTNKLEYVFSIQNDNCNIYCGASVNVSDDNGMFGSVQYFRFRNLGDNSAPFCGFICDLGKSITVPTIPETACKSGACSITNKGLYWPVKRFTNDEIVLHGCGGDEYIYRRNNPKSEFLGFDE